MTAQEIAKTLKVEVKVVYELLKTGEIKGEMVDGAWQVSQEAFDDFLERARVKKE